jgi:hypothetical protein
VVVRNEIIEKNKSFFFFIGFVATKLRYIPFPRILILSNIVALIAYSLGYIFWLIACQFYADSPNPGKHWYSFAQFKNQHRIAALLGIIAMVCCVTSLFIPNFLITGSWLFAISNCISSISEYHKLKASYMHDEDYSHSQQECFFHFSIAIASLTLMMAMISTLSILYPTYSLSLYVVSIFSENVLSTTACYYWLEYTFGNHKPDNKKETFDYESESNILQKMMGHKEKPKQPPINSCSPKIDRSRTSSLTNPNTFFGKDNINTIIPTPSQELRPRGC